MSDMQIQLDAIRSGYDRATCWIHPRAGVIPRPGSAAAGRDTADAPATVVITMQKARLDASDVFYELNDMRSDDGGRTWSDPTPHARTLGRRPVENGVEEGVSDFTPTWHAKTGVLLGTGHTVRYLDDHLAPQLRARSTAYSMYDPAARSWSPWAKIEMPDDPKFFNAGAGNTQRVDLPDGDIFLPIYFAQPGTGKGVVQFQGVATVLRCTFDGTTMRYVEHGTELTVPESRGFVEPSLVHMAGRYFLTLRNDESGYVASSDDGLHFDEPRPWTFDDGTDLGSYNTQQHWLPLGDDLYLVYTRRGANNDHVMRHRAPLLIAQVDTDRLCVIRDTEKILVPERGARLGNFGITSLSPDEAWVTVAEWMQTKPPNWWDYTVCEKYGSDNSVFVARVHRRSRSDSDSG